MRRLILGIASLAVFAMSCASTDTCTKDLKPETFSVTITKGMCFGMCPVYSATVLGDGRIRYEGRANVERMGDWSGAATKEDLCALLNDVRSGKLMMLDTTFVDNVPDAPVTTITITDQGRTRTFRWNVGTPEPLRALAQRMVAMTHENATLKK
jgi:hypothetical protein